jgi:hypothetical protein
MDVTDAMTDYEHLRGKVFKRKRLVAVSMQTGRTYFLDSNFKINLNSQSLIFHYFKVVTEIYTL